MKKNIIITVLVAVIALLIWDKLTKRKVSEQKVIKKEVTHTPTKVIKAADSTDIAVKEVVRTVTINNTLMPETERYYRENVEPELKKAAISVESLSKISAVAKGEVKVATITLPDNSTVKISKAETIRFTDKDADIVIQKDDSGKVLPAKYTINTDFVAVQGKQKPKLFWQKEKPVDIFKFSNPNIRISNVENFTKAIQPRKSVLQIQAESGVQYGFNHAYNSQFTAGISAIFNGDGFISPYVGYGKLWNLSNGTPDNYGKAGVNVNIINWKR